MGTISAFFCLVVTATATSVLPAGVPLATNDGEPFSSMGIYIVSSSTFIWVGAPGNRFNRDPGSVYKFDYLGNQLAKIQPNVPVTGDGFGSGLAIMGDENIFVGRTWEEPAGLATEKGKGSLHAFHPNNTERFVVESIDARDSDNFGLAIATFGNYLLVGSPKEHPFVGSQDGSRGSAYILDSNGNTIVTLQGKQDFNGSWFGASVALTERHAVVGAYQPLGGSLNDVLGTVYVFNYSGFELFQLTSTDVRDVDLFGLSVAANDDVIVVGSPGHVASVKSGAAYVFSTSTGQEITKLIPNDGALDDGFGFNVDVSESFLVVGSPLHSTNGGGIGAAYLYNATTFEFLGKVTESGTVTFGRRVHLTDIGYLVVGDPNIDNARTGAPTSGMAFAYDLSNLGSGASPSSSPTAQPTTPAPQPATPAQALGTVEIVGIIFGVIGVIGTVVTLYQCKKDKLVTAVVVKTN